MTSFFRCSLCLGCLTLLIGPLTAKNRHKAAPPQDQIEVVAHLPLSGDAITRFLVTQHYRRNYLYAEAVGGNTVTLIDVTDANKPSILADLAPSLTGGNVVSVAGTAALISSAASAGLSPATPQTFRIMSFADPAHPVVSQEFPNVSAIGRDDKRGLIFLANAQGLWILHERFAMDPEYEKEWEHMMLDAR